MENDQTLSPLTQWFAGLLEEGRQHDQQIAALHSEAQRLTTSTCTFTRAKALAALKSVVAKVDRSQTNSANRRGKNGRAPDENWHRRCGMDPVDALLMPTIFEQLGKPLRPATFDRMLEDHAIGRDPSLAKTPLRTRLKSLRVAPRGDIKRAVDKRKAILPEDRAELQAELKAIWARAGEGL